MGLQPQLSEGKPNAKNYPSNYSHEAISGLGTVVTDHGQGTHLDDTTAIGLEWVKTTKINSK